MADIRFKDLTTTASSTASDDFIAVDGTTNGTRKLNAFSPTFGGNVVVTGTLTAGSGSHVFGNSANTAEIKAQRLTTDPSSVALQAVASHAIINFTGDTGYTWGRIGSAGNEILRIYHAGLTSITAVAGGGLAVGGGLNVSATTASTSTSSGALVVSGGVGVAGAINVGASGLSLFAGNADTSIQVGAVAPYQRATVGITRRLNYGDVLFGRNLQGKTSSDNYTTVGTDTSGGGYGGFEVQFGGVARILLGTGNTTQGSDVTPTVALSASTTNATFIGSVTTAAPAGGTAAAWKLGTVATVSPTSPNRTIEVDIGGTIYYIHAKTTNN